MKFTVVSTLAMFTFDNDLTIKPFKEIVLSKDCSLFWDTDKDLYLFKTNGYTEEIATQRDLINVLLKHGFELREGVYKKLGLSKDFNIQNIHTALRHLNYPNLSLKGNRYVTLDNHKDLLDVKLQYVRGEGAVHLYIKDLRAGIERICTCMKDLLYFLSHKRYINIKEMYMRE